MEVSPITPLTAQQYGIPGGTQGLVVAEAEVPAAAVGIEAGDVIVAVDGIPTPQMTAFFQATKNGIATEGVVDFIRKGQSMRVNLSSTAVAPAAGTPNTLATIPPITMAPATMPPNNVAPAAFRLPQGNFAPAQTNTGTWPAQQGTGMARGVAPGTGRQW